MNYWQVVFFVLATLGGIAVFVGILFFLYWAVTETDWGRFAVIGFFILLLLGFIFGVPAIIVMPN